MERDTEFDFASPPRAWFAEDATLPLDMPNLSGPNGPFFNLEAAAQVPDSLAKLEAKTDAPAEQVVLNLMRLLGRYNPTPQTTTETERSLIIETAVHSMGQYYRDTILSHKGYHGPSFHRQIKLLRDETKEHNANPLIRTARQLVELYPGDRNTDVEAICRLLVEHEIDSSS